MPTASPLVDSIVGGWSLNGDFHYSSGTPISVRSTNYYQGFNSVYVNLAPGCKLTSGSRKLYQPWLNSACFQNPAAGAFGGPVPQLGTAGGFQEQVRNPGVATEDLGLHKSLYAGADHQYNLNIRLEFFNVFNRHQLGGPDTNLADPLFGYVLGYGGDGGRIGQLGARFTF
jgi:hypothetical protein